MTSRLPAGVAALGLGLGGAGMASAQTILFDGVNFQVTNIPAGVNFFVFSGGPLPVNNIQDNANSPIDFIGGNNFFTLDGTAGLITVSSINAEPEIDANQANVTLDLINVAVTSDGANAVIFGDGAVLTLTKALAQECAPRNIRVNAIAPGVVATERVKRLLREDDPIVGKSLLGVSDPIDVAYLALYLASDESRRVTGAILPVDSGASAH